ncbi:hypothetical protein [Bartonella pachyuromydis]|uniref:Protein-disulfide reductase n=1 Tax=Bartonella pachyuromydis TaxID=931097 RepID=A0ABP8VDV6_9HYPH
MIKIFKNNLLNIFIVVAFFLSQVVNVHANHLNIDHQKENIAVSVIEQGKQKAINIATLFVPNAFHETKNDVAAEGKIEKVLGSYTLGIFTEAGALGFGFATGFIMSVLSAIIGWAIGKTKA